ncbi:MAG: hypothetical protein LGB67_06555 [Sulfurovum sp.]|nr:hypothetical protein [Sulfurovum sp.]
MHKGNNTMQSIVFIRHVTFLIHTFDNDPNEVTLGEIRQKFKEEYKTPSPFYQYFGIYRLMPLILIKEEYRKQKKDLSDDDIKTIKIIRDAVVHNDFSIEKKGYTFRGDSKEREFTYMTFEEFKKFIYRIENEFYIDNIDHIVSDIGKINTHLKYTEFLLRIFANDSNEVTLGEIRQRFEEKFETLSPSLDQYFGIYRLISLVLIREENKEQSREMPDDLKFVRNAVAHGRFSIEEGYIFSEKKKKIQKKYTYEKIVQFIDEIEKIFHKYYKDSKK